MRTKTIDKDLEYNPYLPNKLFFDVKKAELKINNKKFSGNPRFSVIIPTYNRKKSLMFTLNNLFRQSYPNSKYEIIVVDDGSEDGTLNLMKKIKPSCNFKYFYWPRLRIKFKKEHKNQANFYNRAGLCRNIGINNSQGEIILFNDSDILVERNCLKKHERYHNSYNNIIVRGFRMFLPKTFKPILSEVNNFKFLKNISKPEKDKNEIKLYYHTYKQAKNWWHRFITANLSIKKEYLDKVGGFSRDFIFWGFEDVDLGYRLNKSFKIKFIWDSKIKVYHINHKKEAGTNQKYFKVFKIGANILYNKYLDNDIVLYFSKEMKNRFNKYVNTIN